MRFFQCIVNYLLRRKTDSDKNQFSESRVLNNLKLLGTKIPTNNIEPYNVRRSLPENREATEKRSLCRQTARECSVDRDHKGSDRRRASSRRCDSKCSPSRSSTRIYCNTNNIFMRKPSSCKSRCRSTSAINILEMLSTIFQQFRVQVCQPLEAELRGQTTAVAAQYVGIVLEKLGCLLETQQLPHLLFLFRRNSLLGRRIIADLSQNRKHVQRSFPAQRQNGGPKRTATSSGEFRVFRTLDFVADSDASVQHLPRNVCRKFLSAALIQRRPTRRRYLSDAVAAFLGLQAI